MSWIIPALLSPVFAAVVNHIDKQLLSRFFKGGGPGSLVIFSSFVGLPVIGLIWLMHPDVTSITFRDALLLIGTGVAYMLAVLPYFYAMAKDDADVVAPLFQMISAIGYIFGVLFLGEQLKSGSLVGGLLVFVGAIILSLETTNIRKLRIKKGVFFLMLLSSTLFAVNGTIFKLVAVDTASFWISAFWDYVGVALFGVGVYLFIPSYRRQFQKVMRLNSQVVLSLNAINEICAVSAQLLLNYATLLAPLAMVYWVAEGFQPVFVFLFAMGLATLKAKERKKFFVQKTLLQKSIAIIVMLIGTYLLIQIN